MIVHSQIQKNGKNHVRDVKETTQTIGEKVIQNEYRRGKSKNQKSSDGRD